MFSSFRKQINSIFFIQKRSYEQEFLFLRKNNKAFIDISINGESKGRITFELFTKYLPKTSLNFFNLCQGVTDSHGKVYSYKNTKFNKVLPGLLVQGGEVEGYKKIQTHENYFFPHDQSGVLAMANLDSNSYNSQFFITTSDCSW